MGEKKLGNNAFGGVHTWTWGSQFPTIGDMERRAEHAYLQSRCKVERQGSTRQPCASPLEHRRILVASGRRLLDSCQASKLEQSALKQALDLMRQFEG
jgi:hypothetical protein